MSIDFEPLKKWYGEQKWTDYMDEQNENVDLLNEKLEMLETSESVRDTNETARETAEGIRDTNETARESAEGIREENEGDRKAAELLRKSAESDRETAYGLAEEARDGLYETAEGDRDSAYGLAENARDSLYSTAEGSRNTDYGLAETARDSSYTSAEELRTTAFNTAQSDRATAFNTAQSDRATAFSTAESARTTTFNTAENTRNSNEVTRIANENARIVYEDYNPAKDYVVGNKVAYQGSSYRNKAPCKGIVPTNTTYWLLIAAKGDTGDISNLTATHISNALGFLPIEYTEGTNVQISEAGKISATDTKTTINGKTGAIAKADITALGIPGQDTTYTAGTNIEIASGVIKNIVTDQGTDPDWAGVKYKFVMINGELFAEVVAV